MGFDFGLQNPDTCFKRRNRWLFKIDGISATDTSTSTGINALPPSKAARPSLTFKEIEVQHLNETIYFPGKPDWKPVSLVLYDLKKNKHPIFEWIKLVYDPKNGDYKTSCNGFKKPNATLELYDGCGEVLETWVYETVYPQVAEFGELDMSSSELLTCDLTIRYDRAYIQD